MYSVYEELKKAFYENRKHSNPFSHIGYECDSYDCRRDDFIFDDDDADCICD